MDQPTIFDQTFDEIIRRRELMPKWLVVYTWFIIFFGLFFFTWTVFFMPDEGTASAQEELATRLGGWIGRCLPGTSIILMGLLVWLERRRAIRFNWGAAIGWALLVAASTIKLGPRGLAAGVLILIFIPYWVGLYHIQRKWEKEAVRGKRSLH